jgi:SAM-dependent methyltransferase
MWLLLVALLGLDGQGRAMLDPLREKILQPEQLIARLHVSENAVIADVGAGPGFFSPHLSRAVPRGRVIATDVRADYLAHLEALHLPNVVTRVVAPDDPSLAARSIDLALLCQVDQYLGDRAVYFSKLVASLRKGGRIVLVNYVEHRAADLAAAAKLNLKLLDQWEPSAGFFVLVLGT